MTRTPGTPRLSLRITLAVAVLGLLLVPLTGRADKAHADWGHDFAKASAEAAKSGKAVLLLFTGSDWCPPCIEQDKEIFASAGFKQWAKANVVLVEADFPHRKPQSDELKKHNNELKSKYQPQGFPTVLILDPDGNEHARWVGYDKEKLDIKAWIKRATPPTNKAKPKNPA